MSENVKSIYRDGVLKQVDTPQSLVIIESDSEYSYEILFFKKEDGDDLQGQEKGSGLTSGCQLHVSFDFRFFDQQRDSVFLDLLLCSLDTIRVRKRGQVSF